MRDGDRFCGDFDGYNVEIPDPFARTLCSVHLVVVESVVSLAFPVFHNI